MSIAQIQQWLKDHGYDPGPIDGKNGPRTRAAVEAYQRANGLTVDGIAGPQTQGKMQGGGGSAPAATGSTPTADASGPWTAYAWALDEPGLTDPATGQNVIREAQAGKWTPEQLQAAVQNTDWWRRTQDSEKQWDALTHTDPQQALFLRGQADTKLREMAQSMGVSNIDDATFLSLADSTERYGWTPQDMQNKLASYFKYSPTGVLTGKSVDTIQQINSLASDYMVTLSDATKQDWARQVLAGEVTTDEFKGYLTNMAKSRFPSLANALDRGISVRQYADPYIQQAAQTLELAPTAIDLSDPKWQKFLDFRDPKTNQVAQMTMNEWLTTLRTDPTYGYDKTAGANNQASAFATALAKQFGAIG